MTNYFTRYQEEKKGRGHAPAVAIAAISVTVAGATAAAAADAVTVRVAVHTRPAAHPPSRPRALQLLRSPSPPLSPLQLARGFPPFCLRQGGFSARRSGARTVYSK